MQQWFVIFVAFVLSTFRSANPIQWSQELRQVIFGHVATFWSCIQFISSHHWEAPPKSSLLPDSLCPWALRLHLWSHCALLHLQDSPQLLPGSVFFESRDSFEFKQVRHLRRVPILLILSKEPVFGVQKPYTVSLGCNLRQVYKEFPQTRCAWHVRPNDGPLPLTLETLSRGIRREPNFWFFKEKPIRGGNWEYCLEKKIFGLS